MRPRVGIGQLSAYFVALSPIHYEHGDMRRDYGWTNALLTAILSVGVVGFTVRALLAGIFVAFVTTDILLIVLFNVGMTAVVGRLLLSSVQVHPRDRRQRKIRNERTRPVRTYSRHRQSHRSPTSIDRL
ncbi:hypothetical protein [Haladaptatus sp. DFWS20]|uniref:hypothetical protein n=1 Tax=Haladaptatus sp. DFWS20 TaxID=3403467 RepID=UPI003EB9F143